MQGLLSVLYYLLNVALIVIIVQAVLSWLVAFNVINTYNQFVRSLVHALDRITAPIYRPIRRFLPNVGGLDLSPLVVMIIIICIQRFMLPYMTYY